DGRVLRDDLQVIPEGAFPVLLAEIRRVDAPVDDAQDGIVCLRHLRTLQTAGARPITEPRPTRLIRHAPTFAARADASMFRPASCGATRAATHSSVRYVRRPTASPTASLSDLRSTR